MNRKTVASLTLVAVLVGCGIDQSKMFPDVTSQNPLDSEISTRVIYGEDDRLDLYKVKDARLLKLAKGTSVMMDSKALTKVGDQFSITSDTFEKTMGVCKTEPYADQYSAGNCSGFLIASNVMVTAGHCIRTQSNCNSASFVFDYAVTSSGGKGPKQVMADQVYHCKRVLGSKIEGGGADFSVVELDRNVTGREPLTFRKTGHIAVGEPLVVIGHPSGIPTKVAGGANVRTLAEGFFVANLDTYGGNSGSAVFNSNTGLIEGILVRGETDFVYKNGCKVSNVCTNEGCRGEDVTYIAEAFDAMDPTTQNAILEEEESREMMRSLLKWSESTRTY